MFSKDMLCGILLSSTKMDLNIVSSDASAIGYRVRLRLNIRANAEFLLAVQRSLLQHGIETTYRSEEHSTRRKPILRIGGIKNLYLLKSIVNPNLPHSKGEWDSFLECVDIISEKKHLTLEGMERLFEIKGVV